jgi:competence protein ComEA
MSKPADREPTPDGRYLWRRMDQVAIAAVTMAALVTMAGYWFAQGGHRGRLIELERATRESARFQIDVNEADWPEFSQLPGIGETLARRIVESRDAQGPFADLDDLRRVRGVGGKTLEQIKPYLLPVPQDGTVAAGRQ